MRFFLPLAIGVLTVLLPAQGVVPPFVIRTTSPHVNLSPGVIPGTYVSQINMIHLPSDPANVFYCSMTVTNLVGFGAVGGYDVLTGSYDVTTDTFTPNSEAAALNTTGMEFGLMVHHTGLYAVFDRITGVPRLARRTAIGQPWVEVGPINQVATTSGADPSLADYRGQTWLLFILNSDVVMQPIDLTTGNLTGSSVVVVRPAMVGGMVNSPSPILDANNQLIGLSHHDVLASDNDHYVSLDLEPATPSVLMYDTTTWINNGGFIGGRFFDAEAGNVFSMDTFWCPGSRAPVNSTMTVDFYSPPTTGPDIYLSALMAGVAFLQTPLPLPGLPGLLGLNPAGATWFGLYMHNNVNGKASTSFPIPNIASLRGVRLSAQSATLEALTGGITLANTAALIID